MNKIWESHALLGMHSVRSLPAWELELLRKIPPSGPELKLFPACQNGAEQLAASCLLMDWIYDPVFAGYARQANGSLFPHMLPDADGQGAFFAGNAPSPEITAVLIEQKMQEALCAWQKKNYLDFFRHAGILGHFLQDITAPTHVISPGLLRNLFPDPEPSRYASLQGCYTIAENLPLPEPSLAGRTVQEAAFHLMNDAFWAADRAQKLIPELMQAVYARSTEDCCRILKQPATDAALLTARAWHTVFSLAAGRLPEQELEKLSVFPLDQLFPVYKHPSLYAGTNMGVLCLDGKKRPLRLRNGDTTETFRSGFGMTGHSGFKFYLHGQFSTLRFTVGLADHKSSLLPRIDLRFTVETTQGWNQIFSEDMNFNGEVIYETRLTPDTPLIDITVDLHHAGTLIFASHATPYKTPDGEIAFDIPHLAVVSPILIR